MDDAAEHVDGQQQILLWLQRRQNSVTTEAEAEAETGVETVFAEAEVKTETAAKENAAVKKDNKRKKLEETNH